MGAYLPYYSKVGTIPRFAGEKSLSEMTFPQQGVGGRNVYSIFSPPWSKIFYYNYKKNPERYCPGFSILFVLIFRLAYI